MTINLTIEPEVEAGLLARAQARGMALQQYLQDVVEQDARPSSRSLVVNAITPQEELSPRVDAVRRMLEFGDKYRLTLGEPVSRELLQQEHNF